MHQNPDFSRLSPRAQTLLDKALAGEPPELKARVLQLVLESGISPEEEFFLISLGLNHLKVLLHEAPAQLRNWSATFEQKLTTWSQSHNQTLQLITQKAEATAALTETAGQLATLLTGHTQTCNALVKQLQAAHHAWGDSWELQADVNKQLLTAVQELEQHLTQQTEHLQRLAAEVNASRQPDPLIALGIRSRQSLLHGLVALAAYFVIIGSTAMMFLAVFYVKDRPLQQMTAERVKYLLMKQNQQDCLNGIKSADSPECQPQS